MSTSDIATTSGNRRPFDTNDLQVTIISNYVPIAVILDIAETMYLSDTTVTETDGSTLSFGSLPEAATATAAGTPDWCTGFEELPSSPIDPELLQLSIDDFC